MKRVLDVAASESEIHLVYVQEPMDSVYMGVVPYGPVFVGMDEVEENLKAELKQKLNGIGDAEQIHISAAPTQASHVEMLTWSFPAVRGDGAVLTMQWGTTSVALQVSVGLDI